jgi:hypothetical protein
VISKYRKIKTSNAPELADVKVPLEITKAIEANNHEWLWRGGVFSLPPIVKKQFKNFTIGNPKAYYKAKLLV